VRVGIGVEVAVKDREGCPEVTDRPVVQGRELTAGPPGRPEHLLHHLQGPPELGPLLPADVLRAAESGQEPPVPLGRPPPAVIGRVLGAEPPADPGDGASDCSDRERTGEFPPGASSSFDCTGMTRIFLGRRAADTRRAPPPKVRSSGAWRSGWCLP